MNYFTVALAIVLILLCLLSIKLPASYAVQRTLSGTHQQTLLLSMARDCRQFQLVFIDTGHQQRHGWTKPSKATTA